MGDVLPDPLQLSAVELAHNIRTRRLTAVDVVDAHIERIRDVNPALNAVVVPRFDEARAEAEVAHRRVIEEDPEDLPPMLGVPFTVKEFVAVKGMPQTAGILSRSHTVAEQDATVVARLREAGAIVLGVTNAPEGGLWHETSNPVYGRTSNPHDLHRTSGGSSGGEGAIVAAGGSPFGIGSDAGGSVRIPAAFCGIAGHKPSAGLVPDTGHFPPPPGDGTFTPMVVGPMARYIDDLEAVLDLIVGADGLDQRSGQVALGPKGELHPSELTVYPLPTNGRVRPTPEMEAAVWKSARVLEEQGAQVKAWSGPDLSRTFEVWAALLAETGTRYDQLVAMDRPRPLSQAIRWLFGRADHSGGVIAMMLLERAADVLPGMVGRLAREAASLRQGIERTLGPRGVMLLPVYPRTAPRHRAIALRSPLDVGCTTLFNVSGGPSTALRVDTGPRGLPIGIQVGAARGKDRLTLAVARRLEAIFGVPLPVSPRWGRSAPLGLRLIR